MIQEEHQIRVSINWDFDDLEQSLRRGYLRDYNFYIIYLDRKRDYWKNLDPQGGCELYYIGSTRMNSTSNRLLNNHDGLQSALKDGFGDIYVALGHWNIRSDDFSVKILNDMVLIVESALIYTYLPTKNKVHRMSYDGPKLRIENTLKSYGGLNIQSLIMEQQVKAVDSLLLSDLSENYRRNYFNASGALFEDGLIQLLGRIEKDIPQLNEEWNI